MNVRFLGDANFNQRIIRGLLTRDPGIDFARPEGTIPEKMPDPEVLRLAASLGRVLVSHDARTMPEAFQHCVRQGHSAGLIMVPTEIQISRVIEDLLLVHQATDAEEWVNRIQWLPL